MADGAAPGAGGHQPEDEFDRALRALTEGRTGEARFKELSAAERAKAGAAAAKAARKQAEARARAAKAGQQPARRRGGLDEPPRPRGGRARVVVAVIVAFALSGAGLFALQRLSRPVAGDIAASHVVASGSAPTGTSPLSPSGQPSGPPADPFAGTPAEQWANGAAGIIVQPAKPVGTFTTAQVADAYATTKKLLIAALLDKQTISGGTPAEFARLLADRQRSQFLAGLNARGTQQDGQARSTRKMVMSFAPGTAELVGSVIKVHGTMSATTVHESGAVVLAINVDYTAVYPVEHPGQPGDWMRVLAHQFGFYAFAPWDSPSGPLQPWDQTVIGHAGGRCGMTDGYVHPDYPSMRYLPGPTQSGTPVNPYAPGTGAPGAGARCGSTTGT